MPYLSLKDYGLIGTPGKAVLISKSGSIDWCCLPFLDAPSHFGSILDDVRGGFFKISPERDFHSEQRYLQRTNVLETEFETSTGRAVLTDWMAFDPTIQAESTIFRRLQAIDGKIGWLMECQPRFDYGSDEAQAEKFGESILFRGSSPSDIAYLHSDQRLEIVRSRLAQTRFTLTAGQEANFSWSFGRSTKLKSFPKPDSTIANWQAWAHGCGTDDREKCIFSGPWHDIVVRSTLVVKLLLSDFSGSLAQSATTSLPLFPGSGLNSDARIVSLRNATFSILALFAMGHRQEAERYFSWLADRIIQDGVSSLQANYSLDGNRNLPERELFSLSGYSGSRPVRVGNLNNSPFHLDIFGHVILASSVYFNLFHKLPEGLWPRLVEMAEFLCHAWRRPDYGPWNSHSRAEHFVVSKVFAWSALDKVSQLADSMGLPVPSRWAQEKIVLHRIICEQGYDTKQMSFVRAFGESELDACALLIPLLDFLPINDERITGTIRAVREKLGTGPFLARYSDHLRFSGTEIADPLSTLWLVSCLAKTNSHAEGAELLNELCSYSSPLGLFGERIETVSGKPAGNFPSTIVHLALINAAMDIAIARKNDARFQEGAIKKSA